jgi:hypothetical protein
MEWNERMDTLYGFVFYFNLLPFGVWRECKCSNKRQKQQQQQRPTVSEGFFFSALLLLSSLPLLYDLT